MVTPNSLSFDSRPVGGASAPKNVTVANSSAFPLHVYSVATNSQAFVESDNCMGVVRAHGSCSISVAFAPTSTGRQTAVVKVTDETNSSGLGAVRYPHSVALYAMGTDPTQSVFAAPAALSFAPQKVGTASGVRNVTLTNLQKTALHVTSISAGGDFTVAANNCGSSLASNSSCIIGVGFAPQAAGARSGALTIANGATRTPLTVALSGAAPMPTATPAPTAPAPAATPRHAPTHTAAFTPTPTPIPTPAPVSATLRVKPQSLNLGQQVIGSASALSHGKLVTLSNPHNRSQNQTITVQSVKADGDFVVLSNGCVGPLAPGARCAVKVFFIPKSSGAATGMLTITSNARNAPHIVPLRGTGMKGK